MRPAELWRTTVFRLTTVYGAIFAVAVFSLVGLIYWRTAGYLDRQTDALLRAEAASFSRTDPAALPIRIDDALRRDVRKIDLFGLFSADGVWITGNVQRLPAGLKPGGPPQLLAEGSQRLIDARAMVVRLPWGELLVVGRDVTQLAAIRRIVTHALIWSGALILVLGLLIGTSLSLIPLYRVRTLQAASRRIMGGDLGARLPLSAWRDELDLLARIVNAMMDEIERLVAEAQSVGDAVAHDLRTPLTRLRAFLYRLSQQPLGDAQAQLVDQALTETDGLLARFRALLRIGEVEQQHRRAGFGEVDLRGALSQLDELYRPVAEDAGVALSVDLAPAAPVHADPELMVEAVGNLIDNAIKFSPPGGRVEVTLEQGPSGPRILVADSGPGIPEAERAAVLGRFHRSERGRETPGFGLGLSIVDAVMRVHGFGFRLEDADPGLRAVVECWPRAFEH